MWMTLNQTAMSALLASPTTMPRLGRRYRHVFCPDESYPHSVLGNTAGVVVCPRAHRYVDWSPGHPKTLDAADVPSMAAAGAWFARKFDLESSEDLCGLVDEMVGSTT
jgi:hypothetical protein